MWKDKNTYVKEQIALRLENIAGKYVIIRTGKYGSLMFLQDMRYAKNQDQHWTLFKANALGFDTFNEAQRVARRFKIGAPQPVAADSIK